MVRFYFGSFYIGGGRKNKSIDLLDIHEENRRKFLQPGPHLPETRPETIIRYVDK